MSLTVGSLFSGIGGIDLGLKRAGMKVLWQVEKDPYARRVLAKNFPGVPILDDIRECTSLCGHHPYAPNKWRLCPVDVLAGGFPCQDISVAGKGAGIKEGTRSGLWSEFARLVRELRPRYVLVENVPALRSRGLDRVLGDLAASGYVCEWDGLPASTFGAPHQRDRLVLVAYAHGQGEPQPRRRVFEKRGRSGDGGQTLAHADRQSLAVGGEQPAREELPPTERGGAPDNPWAVEPDVGRVAHGVPARVDRLRCLGNAVVPQVAEFVGRCIVAHANSNPAAVAS